MELKIKKIKIMGHMKEKCKMVSHMVKEYKLGIVGESMKVNGWMGIHMVKEHELIGMERNL